MLWPGEVPLQPSGSQGSPGSCEQRLGERDFVLDLVFPKVRLGFAGCCGLGPSSLDVGWSICLHFFGLWIMTFTEFFPPLKAVVSQHTGRQEKGRQELVLGAERTWDPMRVTLSYLLYTRETPFKGTGVCPGWISYLPLVTVVAGICNSSTLWKWKQIPSPREQPDFMGEYLGSKARPCEGEERGCSMPLVNAQH